MNLETIQMTVAPRQSNMRLDSYLAAFIKHISRNKVQKLIKNNLVEVNGKFSKHSYLVSPGDVINIKIPKPKKIDVVAENIPLDIVYEDQYLAIINKAAGMVVHPTYSLKSGTLVNALMYHMGDQLSSVTDVLRPGIVHRLDKDTTGLMVIAKDDRVHKPLADQFASKSAQREYLGICMGRFTDDQGRVETLLSRWQKDRRMMMPSRFEGKKSITNYYVLRQFKRFSIVKFKLETGRTHQIRTHMLYLKKPLFADPMYGGRNIDILNLPNNQKKRLTEMLTSLNRQALHARKLTIVHPVLKKEMIFEAPLPTDMQEIIKKIKDYEY